LEKGIKSDPSQRLGLAVGTQINAGVRLTILVFDNASQYHGDINITINAVEKRMGFAIQHGFHVLAAHITLVSNSHSILQRIIRSAALTLEILRIDRQSTIRAILGENELVPTNGAGRLNTTAVLGFETGQVSADRTADAQTLAAVVEHIALWRNRLHGEDTLADRKHFHVKHTFSLVWFTSYNSGGRSRHDWYLGGSSSSEGTSIPIARRMASTCGVNGVSPETTAWAMDNGGPEPTHPLLMATD
jgi:hypothetical protein